MKVFFRNIHLYLSLAAGLVIAIVCFTGAVLVFEKELKMAFNSHQYTVEVGTQRVPLEQLVANLQKEIPKAQVTSVKVYSDPTRSVELNYKDPNAPQPQGGEKGVKGGGRGEKARGEHTEKAKEAQAGALVKAAKKVEREAKGEKAGEAVKPPSRRS
ncbi:PepSY domain-containing protein [Rufibacter ruber]|uniref:PepSY domain-containing protein n=1 Tax=Rufibacter ruber TaxID=1783499 RepID=UPI00083518D6|nr:PepSY domain-containing protein [Rufibacter ruber]